VAEPLAAQVDWNHLAVKGKDLPPADIQGTSIQTDTPSTFFPKEDHHFRIYMGTEKRYSRTFRDTRCTQLEMRNYREVSAGIVSNSSNDLGHLLTI